MPPLARLPSKREAKLDLPVKIQLNGSEAFKCVKGQIKLPPADRHCAVGPGDTAR